jgi:phosphate transport system substrate-binding protein
MWQQQKDSIIINLSLVMAVATTPMVANLLISLPVEAEPQSNTPSPGFSLPKTVENGTVVKVDGSINSVIVNQSLKEKFETQFAGSQIEIGINGNDDAIKSVLDGKVDIASLGRKLTLEEKAKGLEQVLVRREKIAIIVGINNPFYDGLTTEKFAKIFRGEITDWSELGNAKGKIRFIDRPTISDTRNSFNEYSVFKSGQFLTGSNAVQMVEDNTPNIIKELGDDGISYILANQISKLQDVRSLKVQDYLPNNSKYPFSQSFVYVYKQNPSPKVRDFLGFILSKPGQESVEAAREAEALAIAASALQTISIPTVTPTITPTTTSIAPLTTSTVTPTATPTTTATATPTNTSIVTPVVTPTTSVSSSPAPTPDSIVTPQPIETGGETLLVNPFINPSMITKNLRFFLLLPLLMIGGLSTFIPLWLRRKKRLPNEERDTIPEATPTLLEAEAVVPFTTNNHNGNSFNGANYYKEENSQEVTAIGNVALLDLPQTTSTINPRNTISDSDLDLDLDYDEVFWDTEAPVIVVNNHYPQILNINRKPMEIDTPIAESDNSSLQIPEPPAPVSKPKITSLSELLGLSATPTPIEEDITLSEFLNTPPTTINQPTEDQYLLSDLPSELGEALNAISNQIDIKTPDIEEEISPTPLNPPATDEDIAMELNAEIEAWTNINQSNVDGNTRIIFTPRTPKWAYVSWYISASHQQTLHNQGFTTLAVRLYDVTNLDLSYQRPQIVQQYECETAIYDRYVPIPRGECDYMTEIGYLNYDNQWLCLARSGIVRIFSRPSADFWFVVDAELVIHGATEQGATITFDGQKVKLNPDGTFKLTIPFMDNFVDYQMTATSANKEDTKTIQKKFSQE